MKKHSSILFISFGFIFASLLPCSDVFGVAFDSGFSFEIRSGNSKWETAIYDFQKYTNSATYDISEAWPNTQFEYTATWDSASGIATFVGTIGGDPFFNLTKNFSAKLAGYAPGLIILGMRDDDSSSGFEISADGISLSSGIEQTPGYLGPIAISVANPSHFTVTGTFAFSSDTLLGEAGYLQGWVELHDFRMVSVPDASIFYLLGPGLVGLGLLGRRKLVK